MNAFEHREMKLHARQNEINDSLITVIDKLKEEIAKLRERVAVLESKQITFKEVPNPNQTYNRPAWVPAAPNTNPVWQYPNVVGQLGYPKP